MVPGAGLEPTLPCGKEILSLQRLPFRHPGISAGTIGENRAETRAFRNQLPQRGADAYSRRQGEAGRPTSPYPYPE